MTRDKLLNGESRIVPSCPMALCSAPWPAPHLQAKPRPGLEILKPGKTRFLNLLDFDSCLLWNMAPYLVGWLNYKCTQLNNQDTTKQIVQSFHHQNYPLLSGEKNFACTKTRLAITLSKLWHTMSLIRHDLNNIVSLLVLLTCFLIVWSF